MIAKEGLKAKHEASQILSITYAYVLQVGLPYGGDKTGYFHMKNKVGRMTNRPINSETKSRIKNYLKWTYVDEKGEGHGQDFTDTYFLADTDPKEQQ